MLVGNLLVRTQIPSLETLAAYYRYCLYRRRSLGLHEAIGVFVWDSNSAANAKLHGLNL